VHALPAVLYAREELVVVELAEASVSSSIAVVRIAAAIVAASGAEEPNEHIQA
jgi:hypothetical protein